MVHPEAIALSRCLFVVEEPFHVPGRGVIPALGFVPREGEIFRIGDRLRLVRPDGTTAVLPIGGIDVWPGGPVRSEHQLMVLFHGLGKADLPVGSEVRTDAPDESAESRAARRVQRSSGSPQPRSARSVVAEERNASRSEEIMEHSPSSSAAWSPARPCR